MADEQKESGGTFFGFVKDALNTVLKPAIKSAATNMLIDSFYAAADTAKNITERQMWKGQTPPTGVQSRSRYPQQTNYQARYQQANASRPQQTTQPPQQDIGLRSSTNLQYVVAPNRETADKWQAELIEHIRKYGKVAVSQLYDKTEGQIKPLFPDFDYGWTNEADIHYVRNADGFWFNLPTPTKLK